MRKLVMLGVMLAMILAFAAPALADTVTADGLIAGELEGGAVVAGSPNLAIGAPTLGLGQDAAGAGDFNDAFAIGLNDPFAFNLGIAVGDSSNAFAASGFLDNAVFVQSGNLQLEFEDTFFD